VNQLTQSQKLKKEYGTNGNNGTDGKEIKSKQFRLFRYFRLFRTLSSALGFQLSFTGLGLAAHATWFSS
jgi:hypothetical protein